MEVLESPNTTVEPKYYTVDDVAKILKIGRGTAYRLINSDGFPTIRIGKSIRIPIEWFNIWMDGHINKELTI